MRRVRAWRSGEWLDWMEATATIAECANPGCSAAFQRFGAGQLFVFPITDPLDWNLPAHAKQKVVWLCPGCCEHLYVRLNRRKRKVQIINKRAATPGASEVMNEQLQNRGS